MTAIAYATINARRQAMSLNGTPVDVVVATAPTVDDDDDDCESGQSATRRVSTPNGSIVNAL